MKSGLWLLLLGLTCAVCTACGQGDEPVAAKAPAYVVLCQVPRETSVQENAVVPAGGRVVVADPAHPERPPRVLSEGFHAAGDAAVNHDGQRVCFVGRKKPTDHWSIYACTLEGDSPERITSTPGLCGSPAWLPDGRVVFCAETRASDPETSEVAPLALYVAPAGGGPSERITFSGRLEVNPHVLSDGRIIYAGWRPGPDEDPGDGAMALFTVHPDGAGVTLFHDEERAVFYGHPRQGPDGAVYALRWSAAEPVRVAVIDWRAPLEADRVLDGARGTVSVEPAADGSLFVVQRDDAAGRSTVRRFGADGTAIDGPLFEDSAWDVVRAVDASPRRKPQGHLSTIDIRKEYGTLLAVDTAADDVVGATTARFRKWVREVEDEPAVLEDVGQVQLEEDGSFFVRVPADVPLQVELLDEAGKTLKTSRTPFWVRPNEIRGCTGCHDPADVTPPNRRPMAVLKDPVVLREGDR